MCYEKHADTLWFNLGVSSDCGHYNDLSFEYYCCLEGYSGEEKQKALQKKFGEIPNHIKYKKSRFKEYSVISRKIVRS